MTAPSPWRRDIADLLRLAGPVAVARLGIMGMGLADVIIVGRFSAQELGFMALSWGLTSVILTAGVGVLAGIPVLTARYVGQGRPELTGGVLRRGLAYSAALGAVSAVMLILLGPFLLDALHLAPGLAQGASSPCPCPSIWWPRRPSFSWRPWARPGQAWPPWGSPTWSI